MSRRLGCLATILLAFAGPAFAQDANITLPVDQLEQILTQPFTVTQADISRPKVKGDITLKADVVFGDKAMRVKLRKAEPGADTFNNVPRYDQACYELQKLFLDPAEYVVPPTVLRLLPQEFFTTWSQEVRPTFKGSKQVLGVLQYWLNDTKIVADVLSPARFDNDPAYARHIGQLNIFTYLIAHSDSNTGNFIVGRDGVGARVFSVDNGIAFSSEASERGYIWKQLRVTRLPKDTVARLRQITPEMLAQKLGSVAQWELRDGNYVPVAPTAPTSAARGVREEKGMVQMGLNGTELKGLYQRLQKLLKQVDSGEITLVDPPTG